MMKNKKLAVYEDFVNKARAFKQDESRLNDEGVRQGYLRFLCPTPKDEVMFWAAYDALDMSDNKKQESSFKKVWNDLSYDFSLANIGVYAVNLVADLGELYYRALKEFLSLFKMQRASAEKQETERDNVQKQEKDEQIYGLSSEKSKDSGKRLEKSARSVQKINQSEIEVQKQQITERMRDSRSLEDERLKRYNESVKQRSMQKQAEPTFAQEFAKTLSI